MDVNIKLQGLKHNKVLRISMVFGLISLKKNLRLIWAVGLILDGQILMNPMGYLESILGHSSQDG
jgi:hypothetical protein